MFLRECGDISQVPIKSIWRTSEEHAAKSCWWPSVDSKGKTSLATKHVLLMFPGNPGILEFYIEFLDRVYDLTQKKLEIILVGYLGQFDDASSQPKVFSLQDQVSYKIECIDEIVKEYPKDINLFLVGHSVGAWMCEQIVKRRPDIKFKQIFSLFPTLSKMRVSSKGAWMTKYIFPSTSRKIIIFLVRVFEQLPTFIRSYLVSTLTNQDDHNLLMTTEKFMRPNVVKNCLNMANDEMNQIDELDVNFYQANHDNFTFYYGVDDDWVPIECFEDMKRHCPQANVMLCEDNIAHSFVIGQSQPMAEKLANWLKNYL